MMPDEIFAFVWVLVQLAVGFNLVLPFFLFLAYIATRAPAFKKQGIEPADYAIIVTAYQHTELLSESVISILKLNHERFLVYIVADNCDISDLHFSDPRVILLHPEEVLASNTRSHLYAVHHFKRSHNRVTIIDSDNLVHPEYLNELDKWFNKGFKAVQGYREAKNLNTNYACLDAARDIYYHFYDGKVLFHVGSSATLSGSGMAFTTDIYQSFLEGQDITGAGFDKVLQFALVKKHLRIAFAPSAIVYDEKTAESAQLVNQRSRWINSWFRYFPFGFKLITAGLRALDLNQFLFGVILLRPPLFIFLILSFIFLLINLWLSSLTSIFWALGLICFIISFGLSLSYSNVDRRIYRSLINIPTFVFYQILSVLKIKTLSKRPISTRHPSKSPL